MSEINDSKSFLDPVDIRNYHHFSAVYLAILFFVALNIAVAIPSGTFNKLQITKSDKVNSPKVLGATNEQYVRNLTPIANNQDAANISGKKVAWLNHIGSNFGSPALMVTDLSNNTEKQITDKVNPYGQRFFDIDGNKVVWTYRSPSGGPTDIFLHDLSTSVTKKITSAGCDSWYPSISGNKIAYVSNRDTDCSSLATNVYVYDINTDTHRKLTSGSEQRHFTAISGNYVVYTQGANPVEDLYFYDLTTDTNTALVVNPDRQAIRPDISGTKIVWSDNRDYSDMDIYLYDIVTKKTEDITNDTTNEFYPKISGNNIVWHGFEPGEITAEVYHFDLETRKETRITYNSAHQIYTDVSGNIVTWLDERNGNDNQDIYIYEPPPPPSTPPPDDGGDTKPPADKPPSDGGDSAPFEKVSICHRKSGRGFETITVSDQATLIGHLAHSGDIIPATEGCKPTTIKEVLLPDVFRRKNTRTTDLSKVKDPKKVKDFTLDTLVNRIKFTEPLDLSSQETLNKLNYLNLYLLADKLGIISLDSKKLPELNKKATLTMKKLPHVQTPRVLVDGNEDPGVVSNIKYDRGILDFDVTHFSTFTAAPVIGISSPSNNFQTYETSILLKGIVSDPTAKFSLLLNDKPVEGLKIDETSGIFENKLSLKKGTNTLLVKAVSSNGAEAKISITGQLVEKPDFMPIYRSIGGFIAAVLVVIALYYWRSIRKLLPKKNEKNVEKKVK